MMKTLLSLVVLGLLAPAPAMAHATLQLARLCGLQTAASQIARIGGRDVLLVKRFDRTRVEDGYARARMISALTLLETDETPQGRARWSYVLLVETLRRISERPADDARELFRRMSSAQPCGHCARLRLAPFAGL